MVIFVLSLLCDNLIHKKLNMEDRLLREGWTVASYANIVPTVFINKLSSALKFKWCYSIILQPAHEGEFHLTLEIEQTSDAWCLHPWKLKVWRCLYLFCVVLCFVCTSIDIWMGVYRIKINIGFEVAVAEIFICILCRCGNMVNILYMQLQG